MTPEHTKGAVSKIAVMKTFVQDGYYVYNEMSNVGPVDLVAIHPRTKEVRLVEVKQACDEEIAREREADG